MVTYKIVEVNNKFAVVKETKILGLFTFKRLVSAVAYNIKHHAFLWTMPLDFATQDHLFYTLEDAEKAVSACNFFKP